MSAALPSRPIVTRVLVPRAGWWAFALPLMLHWAERLDGIASARGHGGARAGGV